VFVNGNPLIQVASPSQVGPGQFAVDYSAQTITIGTDPTGQEVRASDLKQVCVRCIRCVRVCVRVPMHVRMRG
jgi:polyferredoxin